ncbi:MAG: hypothetical protein MK110_15505 [Fuerstiella sp.]|nr:hypothetical protein [Fuerstiella sp.]
MNSAHQTRNLWTAFAGVLLLTIVAATADRFQILSGLRLSMNDFLSPGRFLVAAVSESPKSVFTGAEEESRLSSLTSQLQEMEQQRRELIIENTQLHNRLQRLSASNGHSDQRAPLIGFDLVSAQILSRHGMPSCLRLAMIDAGQVHGLRRSELVLDATGTVLDSGIHHRVTDGRPVIAGSVVVGRIARAGRWVSQLVPVTDESYSARIRLIRHSAHGTQTGIEGMLEGTGDSCRISGIADVASVAVGDEVFSADINGMSGPCLYYGTVVKADFESAAGWSVFMKPAMELSGINEVAVVVPGLNADQISAGHESTTVRRLQ